MSPPESRGPAPLTRVPASNAFRIALDASQSTRFAEDANEQLAEIDHWLDAPDLLILDALGGGNFSPAQACEHALSVHARVRRALGFVTVAA